MALATSAVTLAIVGSAVQASTNSGIGLSGLPAGLNGAGVNVAQVEASLGSSSTAQSTAGGIAVTTITNNDEFEANITSSNINNSAVSINYIDSNGQSHSTIGGSSSVSTYYTSNGTVTTNSADAAYEIISNDSDMESTHADAVGGNFYGVDGVASGITNVDNYDAGYFQNNVLAASSYNPAIQQTSVTLSPSAILNSAKIVNQSFINRFPSTATSTEVMNAQAQIDTEYDYYTNTYDTIFVSGVGDGTANTEVATGSQINPPATAYNSISVGAYPYSTSTTGIGPTSDGRDAPDIVAPASATSYSTPMVSGAAAIMVQAGTEADGYTTTDGFTKSAYTTDATDERTIKALLLNGAVKPNDWTNSYTVNSGTYTYNPVSNTTTTPLDPRYGAGILNVDNAYTNLAAGRVAASMVNNNTTALTSPTISQNEGWDYSTISHGTHATQNVAHYVFSLSSAKSAYTLTSTLVWNAQTNAASFSETINNLDLNLYNSGDALVASSASSYDNFQQLYTTDLAPGTYDLQVVDLGGAATWASKTDTYALAFNFQPVPEPAALFLLLSGLMGLALRRHCRA
ncbi:MAG: PEP-CTERM sorting domain-containing protein [Phycisphaerae bacterium]